METAKRDKARQILWFSPAAVSIAPQTGACVSLPQILLAAAARLTYQATSQPPTTQEPHMNHPLCAFARGQVWTSRGKQRA
jgi:hypothetical protein